MPDTIEQITKWRAAFIRVENLLADELVTLWNRALRPLRDEILPIKRGTPQEFAETLNPAIDRAFNDAGLAVTNRYQEDATDITQRGWRMQYKALRKPMHLDRLQEAEPDFGKFVSVPPAAGWGMTIEMGQEMPRDVAQRLVARPMQGMTFTERIRTLTQGAIDIARRSIAQGLSLGRNGRRIARDLNKRLDRPRFELERLARTELQHALVGVQDEFANAYDEVIAGWTYVATLDSRTCPRCGALDGRFYRKGQKRPAIPIHPNCRCFYAPEPVALDKIIPGARVVEPTMGQRTALPRGATALSRQRVKVPSRMTFGEWLRTQDAETRAMVVGSQERARLFMAGEMSLKKAGTARAATIERAFNQLVS